MITHCALCLLLLGTAIEETPSTAASTTIENAIENSAAPGSGGLDRTSTANATSARAETGYAPFRSRTTTAPRELSIDDELDPSVVGVPVGTLTHVKGVRANHIYGTGLVVGLNGTGDQSQATRKMLANIQANADLNIDARDINSKNAAMVLLTADLPPFAENGSHINVTVASLGDATSIVGGQLIQAPLYGDDGRVYALAQGAVVVGGFTASGDGAEVTKNHTTVGIVPNGAIVEETVRMRPVDDQGRITLMLHEPDFTTARRIADAIEARFPGIARPVDAGVVRVDIPEEWLASNGSVALLGEIQRLTVQPRIPARVVVNERTGTIVVGQGVRIEPVAVNVGNLHVTIRESAIASQPEEFAERGNTEVLDRTDITTDEELTDVIVLDPGVSVSAIAESLGALGVSSRDLISLLVALEEAGALHAELVRQ